jgi:hypothetical protein
VFLNKGMITVDNQTTISNAVLRYDPFRVLLLEFDFPENLTGILPSVMLSLLKHLLLIFDSAHVQQI